VEKIISDDLGILAYRKIKSMILSNELAQGQKIVQDKLALDLGISRTPLRSALQMLEAEYLVESKPRSGVVVKKFTPSEIIEVYDCRIALEGTAFKIFTESVNILKISYLSKIFKPYINVKKIDQLKYKSADIEFHNYVLQECGNGFLNRLFQKGNLMIYIDRIGLVRPPEETLQEHLDIIEAIEKKEPDKVEKLTKLHLSKSRDLIKKKLKNEH
jgi:DNA-binding GntR family transcriptional regulator